MCLKTLKTALSATLTGLIVLLAATFVSAGDNGAKLDPQQFARGAKAWSNHCSRCHNMRNIADNSDEDWVVSVMHMRVRANIPGDVARDIAAFLKASNDK